MGHARRAVHLCLQHFYRHHDCRNRVTANKIKPGLPWPPYGGLIQSRTLRVRMFTIFRGMNDGAMVFRRTDCSNPSKLLGIRRPKCLLCLIFGPNRLYLSESYPFSADSGKYEPSGLEFMGFSSRNRAIFSTFLRDGCERPEIQSCISS